LNTEAKAMTAMDTKVTNEEIDELFHVTTKLKAGVDTSYFDRVTVQLLGKELVSRFEDSIRLTHKGKKIIAQAISGDYS
jgi:hypothetical protein